MESGFVREEEIFVKKILTFADNGQMSALKDAYAYCEALQEKGSFVVDDGMGKVSLCFNPENHALAQGLMRDVRTVAAKFMRGGILEAEKVYRACLKFAAPYFFDEAIRYAEFDRPFDKKFYEPRRKQLKPLVDELQRLEDDELDILTISLPPGVGKTTLAIFFLVWIELRHPELSVLGGSHSNGILRGVYDEVLRMLDPHGEYLWCDIFPNLRVAETNAKDLLIDIGKAKRFKSFEFASVESKLSGQYRASNLLYCDDLVDGIETAMSKPRLDKLYQKYYTDYRQRKIGKCKELHIATRWSLYDIIGRLEDEYGGDPRANFLTFPALDENDESNFDYPNEFGFSTKFYHEQREIMDSPSWDALYMNKPIEREGQLYAPDELRRYFDLPDKEPDAILAVCDFADNGGDYWVMPIVYRYGSDYYIEEFICDNGKPDIVEARMVEALLRHKVQTARMETNRGGAQVAKSIQNKLKERGGLTNITTKWTQTNKETRIVMASGMIKQNFLFKDESVYTKEYRTAMNFLTTYTMTGKNKHDDVPDTMAMLTDMVQNYEGNVVKVYKRPF